MTEEVNANLNSESLERTQSLLRQTIDAGQEARNVNKKRGGFTGNVVRFVKRNSEKLGQNSFGIFGERGLKLSGIVGATAGLLAADKAAAALRQVLQGSSIKDAIATQVKEIIPPFLRETIPAILDELGRRQRLVEESARQANLFDRDLNEQLKNDPHARDKARQAWVDYWSSEAGGQERREEERRANEATGVSY